MRHRWRVLPTCALLVPLAIAAGCSDGNGPERDLVLTGSWAGAPWVGRAEALLVGGAAVDTLYLFGTRSSDTDVPQETIRVLVPFTGSGSYSLESHAVAFTVLIGGDAVSAEYGGQSPTAGTVEVDTYDATTGLIDGRLVFDAEAMTDVQPYGPSARFAGGQFRARVGQGHD
jgi:hypothetical protein